MVCFVLAFNDICIQLHKVIQSFKSKFLWTGRSQVSLALPNSVPCSPPVSPPPAAPLCGLTARPGPMPSAFAGSVAFVVAFWCFCFFLFPFSADLLCCSFSHFLCLVFIYFYICLFIDIHFLSWSCSFITALTAFLDSYFLITIFRKFCSFIV